MHGSARRAVGNGIIGLMLVLAVAVPARGEDPGSEGEAPGDRPWVVGIKVAPPFAMRNADGDWTGLSVELWRQVASEIGIDYELRELGLDEMLAGVAAGQLDVGLGAITITLGRELEMDFTHPYLATGLGIAVPHGSGLFGAARRLLSTEFLAALAALAAVLLAVGLALWLVERRRDPNNLGPGLAGIGTSFWWSAVTMTTVGYGDVVPRSALGRLLAIVWMFTSVIVISAFTAAIASSLTVSQLSSIVSSPEDLLRVRVGTAVGTSSATHLRSTGVAFEPYPDVEAALVGMTQGNLDAVVYDAPILRYLARTQFGDRLEVLPFTVARQDYALALPPASPQREILNRAMLGAILSPSWGDILRRYIGDAVSAPGP